MTFGDSSLNSSAPLSRMCEDASIAFPFPALTFAHPCWYDYTSRLVYYSSNHPIGRSPAIIIIHTISRFCTRRSDGESRFAVSTRPQNGFRDMVRSANRSM